MAFDGLTLALVADVPVSREPFDIGTLVASVSEPFDVEGPTIARAVEEPFAILGPITASVSEPFDVGVQFAVAVVEPFAIIGGLRGMFGTGLASPLIGWWEP